MYLRNINENRIGKDVPYNQKVLNQSKTPTNKEISKADSPKDAVSISPEAQALFTEKEILKEAVEINPFDDSKQSLLEFIEQLRQQSEEKNDSSDDLLKCIQIAMRIMDGHSVPVKDEKFLMEHQPEMYLRAVMMRRENEDEKDPMEEIVSSLTSQGTSGESISIEGGEVSSED